MLMHPIKTRTALPFFSSFYIVTTRACSIFFTLLSSYSISCTFSLPLFDGGLVMAVRVRGEVLGKYSSSSQLLSTLLSMHNLVMVEGCEIRPLKLLK